MSGESEAGRKGVDGLTRRIVEHGRETGKPVSEEKARAEAIRVAKLTDREKGLR